MQGLELKSLLISQILPSTSGVLTIPVDHKGFLLRWIVFRWNWTIQADLSCYSTFNVHDMIVHCTRLLRTVQGFQAERIRLEFSFRLNSEGRSDKKICIVSLGGLCCTFGHWKINSWKVALLWKKCRHLVRNFLLSSRDAWEGINCYSMEVAKVCLIVSFDLGARIASKRLGETVFFLHCSSDIGF